MSEFEEFERRMTWMKLARELGQEDDFVALIEAERRDAVEQYRRRGAVCGNCEAETFACTACGARAE